jgi:hypothetical protein
MRIALMMSLVACTASALGAQGVRIRLAAQREPVLMDTLRQNNDLSASPAKVYEATLKAFAALGIPVGNTSSTTGVIGSERFERMRMLNGALLSKSFDCGEGPAGPKADLYRLEIAIAVYVSPTPNGGTGTLLGIAIVAEGRDPTGPYPTPRECSSTGAFEHKLVERITQLAGA